MTENLFAMSLLSQEDDDDDEAPTDEETRLITKDDVCKDLSSPAKQKYPKSVFFIITNEFCERFSFYGLRTILTIYLVQILLYSEDQATVIYHAFSVACYFTPVLGAIISDSYLGKFKTIFYISIIYAIGNITISGGSMPQDLRTMNILSLVGLGLIAVGTGGIKPCVSAFGGDQFKPGQERYLQQFFSFFYLSINLGSTISTFLTPILRTDVHCFGNLTCFPLAFGVPALLMITSLVIFLLGKPLYTINPPEGNILLKVVKCIGHGLAQKTKSKDKTKSHWLDYAEDKYDAKFIREIKTVLHVLLLYLPLPIFWALFDQQGSRWTLQATRMSGDVLGWHLKPDQMQVVNPFLIIILIPVFEYGVYPLFRKCHLLQKPLQRITIGGLLAAAAFVVAGLLEIELEKTYPVLPSEGRSEITLINNSPCKINVTEISAHLDAYQETFINEIPLGMQNKWTFTSENCEGGTKTTTSTVNSTFPVESMMVTLSNNQLQVIKQEDSKSKSDTALAKVRLFYSLSEPLFINGTAYIKVESSIEEYTFQPDAEGHGLEYGASNYIELNPGVYKVYFSALGATKGTEIDEIEVESGGNYIISVFQHLKNKTAVDVHLYTTVKPNSISLLLQIPQYTLITIGEIMFSITGLEFSYSQAPQSMKSVLQAAWLLTVSFGNLIVLIIAEARLFEKQSLEFFLFAILMGLDMMIFAVMAYFYKYVKVEDDEDVEATNVTPPPPYEKTSQEPGKTNLGFDDEDTKF